MFKWMNGYTLLSFVVATVFLINTLARLLFNAPSTILNSLGVILVLCLVWFVVVNLFAVVYKGIMWLEDHDNTFS